MKRAAGSSTARAKAKQAKASASAGIENAEPNGAADASVSVGSGSGAGESKLCVKFLDVKGIDEAVSFDTHGDFDKFMRQRVFPALTFSSAGTTAYSDHIADLQPVPTPPRASAAVARAGAQTAAATPHQFDFESFYDDVIAKKSAGTGTYVSAKHFFTALHSTRCIGCNERLTLHWDENDLAVIASTIDPTSTRKVTLDIETERPSIPVLDWWSADLAQWCVYARRLRSVAEFHTPEYLPVLKDHHGCVNWYLTEGSDEKVMRQLEPHCYYFRLSFAEPGAITVVCCQHDSKPPEPGRPLQKVFATCSFTVLGGAALDGAATAGPCPTPAGGAARSAAGSAATATTSGGAVMGPPAGGRVNGGGQPAAPRTPGIMRRGFRASATPARGPLPHHNDLMFGGRSGTGSAVFQTPDVPASRSLSSSANHERLLPFMRPNPPSDNTWRTDFVDTRFNATRVQELHHIAAGSFGKVVLCKLNAWKCVMKEIVEVEREDWKYPQRELDMLRECLHPNVVTYHGYRWKINSRGALVVQIFMEHMSRSLKQELVSIRDGAGQVRSELLLHVAGEVAKGLSFLHNLNPPRIHRDIKPSNILLDESSEQRPVVKLCDFGLATTGNRAAFTSDPGTSYYKAPEVITGMYDHRADVWSYGGVLHDMLFVDDIGKHEERERSHLRACRCSKPRCTIRDDHWFTEVSRGVFQLMQLCLNNDLMQRPSMDHVLAQIGEMQAFIEAASIDAHPRKSKTRAQSRLQL